MERTTYVEQKKGTYSLWNKKQYREEADDTPRRVVAEGANGRKAVDEAWERHAQ